MKRIKWFITQCYVMMLVFYVVNSNVFGKLKSIWNHRYRFIFMFFNWNIIADLPSFPASRTSQLPSLKPFLCPLFSNCLFFFHYIFSLIFMGSHKPINIYTNLCISGTVFILFSPFLYLYLFCFKADQSAFGKGHCSSSQKSINSPPARSHKLPLILFPGKWPYKNFPFNINMSIYIAIIYILFIHHF